ncbi:MAG: VCBS repeat-containing protein, partial [Planctomycetes bacterium]|nr:VCBS repeat-containing protein [Planctomycetota bacterium]
PTLNRYFIYENQERGSFRLWGELPFSPQADLYKETLSQTGQLKEVVHLPILFNSLDGETPVFILYNGTWISHFRRNEEGKFEERGKRPLYQADTREYEEESRAYFGKNVFYEDLTGEGQPLLVIADNRNGSVDFYSGVSIAGDFKSRLNLRTNGWLLKPVFHDMNSDGLKDLILPSVERIGMFTLLRIFFTSHFDIHYMIFFNRKNPLFPLIPDRARSVSLPLSFSAGPEGLNIKHSMIYSFEGDYNGDGLNDFLCKCSPDRLGVFWGCEEIGFSPDPGLTLSFSSLESCTSVTTRVKDLNGDGISDILLHQCSIERGEDRFDLYLSVPKEN